MIEVELKASLKDNNFDEIAKTAAALGFQEQSHLRETDVYFNGKDRDFRKTDEALRLRSCEDLSGQKRTETLITYKGAKQDARSSTRIEYETEVGSLDTMRKLLDALGFLPMYTVEKKRRELRLDQVTICLDTVKNLGPYLELEILAETEQQKAAAVDRLLELLDTLNVPRENLTRKSYLELIYLS